jgi:hypothetical protein
LFDRIEIFVYLCARITTMNMKRIIYTFATLMALGACQEKSQSTAALNNICYL